MRGESPVDFCLGNSLGIMARGKQTGWGKFGLSKAKIKLADSWFPNCPLCGLGNLMSGLSKRNKLAFNADRMRDQAAIAY